MTAVRVLVRCRRNLAAVARLRPHLAVPLCVLSEHAGEWPDCMRRSRRVLTWLWMQVLSDRSESVYAPDIRVAGDLNAWV